MPDTLLLLRVEHRNLSKLLGLIEDQVAAADTGAPMDRDLLSLAWEYFSDYPDLCHHPKEDLVYELLSRRDPGSCAGLGNLTAEHLRLHELTEAFGEAVRRSLNRDRRCLFRSSAGHDPNASLTGVRFAVFVATTPTQLSPAHIST